MRCLSRYVTEFFLGSSVEDSAGAAKIDIILPTRNHDRKQSAAWGQPFTYDLADSRTARVRASLTFDRRIVCATELLLGISNSAAISL